MPKSPSPQPESAEPADLPGFRPSTTPEEDLHPDETTQSPGPDTTSGQPTEDPSPPAGAQRPASERSSPVSISAELHDELENLTGGVFELAGVAINRLVKIRSRSNTRLWLVTEEEAEDFGTAAARILERRVPEELAEGDGADVLIMGSVLLGYGMRNFSGQPAAIPAGTEDLRDISRAEPAPTTAPPPRQPPPPQQPATVGTAGTPPVVGVEAATPPPPDAISPDL